MTTHNDPRPKYWAQTRILAVTIIAIIGLFSISAPFLFFLGGFTFFGFKLDFYLTMQGIILILVAMIFWYAVRQERIDQAHRVTEDI